MVRAAALAGAAHHAGARRVGVRGQERGARRSGGRGARAHGERCLAQRPPARGCWDRRQLGRGALTDRAGRDRTRGRKFPRAAHSTPGSQTSAFVGGTSHSDAKAFAAYAVGFLPIPVPYLDLYGKAGLARWKLNGSSPLVSAPFSTNGTEFAWGGGVQVHIGNIGGRLEYERFNIPNTNGARVFSLAVFLNLM